MIISYFLLYWYGISYYKCFNKKFHNFFLIFQNGPDWFCIVVGFQNGSVGFYTNTGHLLLQEKLDDKPVFKITCHTGTYGTLLDDIHIFFPDCVCVVAGLNLFQTLRVAKAQLAKGY